MRIRLGHPLERYGVLAFSVYKHCVNFPIFATLSSDMLKFAHKKGKENLLDIFVKVRSAKALDEAVDKSSACQKTLKRQDKAFGVLDKAGLTKKQKSIVDRAISVANDCGAAYGTVAYELGLQDGIKLMSELKEIK